MTSPPAVGPSVPVSFENPETWSDLGVRLARVGFSGTSLDQLAGLVSTAVPLVFACDLSGDYSAMHGVFSDVTVAQCEQNSGSLQGAQPASVSVRIAAVQSELTPPTLRIHLTIGVIGAADGASVLGQFWDVASNQQAVVGQSTCPNCGAPIASGLLACTHCGADVRSVVSVPFVVERLQLY